MRAVVTHEAGTMRLADVPEPAEPGPGQVLVRPAERDPYTLVRRVPAGFHRGDHRSAGDQAARSARGGRRRVAWLLSDKASFVTGVGLPVDGGYLTGA